MARPFPYTFISCPCTDSSTPTPHSTRLSKELSGLSLSNQNQPDPDEDGRTFDPRSRRANYSLYPPEHLLYCEDCHQIKCPRCITEEIVCWYCPNCLFETPSSMVRSEGNRCARNCFNCPICTSPLAVTTLGSSDNGASQNGPWILSCGYCMWTSLDVNIKFDKPTNIRAQLLTINDLPEGRSRASTVRHSQFKSPLASFSSPPDEPESESSSDGPKLEGPMSFENKKAIPDHDSRFNALKSFYRNQISETSTSAGDHLMGSEFGMYSSPSALSRIMSLYNTGVGNLHGGNKKGKSKPSVMREALSHSEGLKLSGVESDTVVIEKMATEGWDGLASMEQRLFQQPTTRFVDDLRPLPVLLRTKRSKRCKACKHILVKPEVKPQSTRFRIRLIALSYLPLTSIRPLYPFSAAPPINLEALAPLSPTQFLLTLKNHMFDPIRITLATPSVSPGRAGNKVTILCPQFEVGANTDVWDEALQSGNAPDPRSSRHGVEKVAEAGKIWDRGRNWTTVAMEVVPGSLVDMKREATDKAEEIPEDEDVIEIPIFVRIEWDADTGTEDIGLGSESKKADTEMVKRELAYWMVLGVGRTMPGI